MKIHIVTEHDTNIIAVSFDVEEAVRKMRGVGPCGGYRHELDIDIPIDFLEASLKAKHLDNEMFEQRNREKLIGLSDLLGCSHARAVKILKDNNDADPEIHKPDKPEQV